MITLASAINANFLCGEDQVRLRSTVQTAFSVGTSSASAVGASTARTAGAAAGSASASAVGTVVGGKTLVWQFGQSNAETHDGAANLSLANAYLANSYSNVQMVSSQDTTFGDNPMVIQTAGPQALGSTLFNLGGGNAQCVGFELSLMHDLDLARTGGFALGRWAVGGSASAQWDPAAPSPLTSGGQNMFAYNISAIQSAMTSLNCTSLVLVWEQGESDAKGLLTNATNYGTWLTAFVAAIRSALGALGPGGSAIPFVFGKLNVDVDSSLHPWFAELRASQVSAAAAIANSTLVSQDSIPRASGKFDGTHYNANGYVDVGWLFSPAVAAYCGIRILPAASFTFTTAQLVASFASTSVSHGDTITTYDWDWGDGTAHGTTATPNHTYGANGTYNVTLTVTNTHGDQNTTAAVPVSVISGIANVTRDALSGFYVPASGTEVRTFLDDASVGLSAKSTATSLYLMQEASSNLVDTIGGLTLIAANPSAYLQTVGGMTRKGVKCADNTAKAFATTAVPDISTNSMLVVAIIQTPAASPTGNRNMIAMGVGANRSHIGIEGTTGKVRCTSGANTATAASSSCDGSLHIIANRVNRGSLEDDAWMDQGGKLTPTASSSMAGARLEIGAQSGGITASDSTYAYMMVFTGQDWTDAEVQTLVTKMKGL